MGVVSGEYNRPNFQHNLTKIVFDIYLGNKIEIEK